MSTMRWTLLGIAALLVAAPAAAQRPAWIEIGGFGQWTRFDENAGGENARPENGFGYGGRLDLFLSQHWQLEADGYYSPQDRKLTEDFCCLGLFPEDVNASAFALRLNYNVPIGGSQLIFGGGAVRTKYAFRGGNSPDSSMSNYGVSGLAGVRVGLFRYAALRLDGVADYMPNHEPEANLNLHLRAGISLLLGASTRAAAVPPPMEMPRPTTPPPPPPPAPRPPPAPVENAITVCVIDLTQPSGVRMQSAFYRPDQRDTVVIQGGSRVPLMQVAGNAMVVQGAAWFAQGQPLDMMVGTEAIRYLAYQTARPMDADRLAYLGTIKGYPAYAERDRVTSVLGALSAARAANPNRDLGAMLAEHRNLREAVEALPLIYLPMQRTGCVFQPMQVMPQVIKGR